MSTPVQDICVIVLFLILFMLAIFLLLLVRINVKGVDMSERDKVRLARPIVVLAMVVGFIVLICAVIMGG